VEFHNGVSFVIIKEEVNAGTGIAEAVWNRRQFSGYKKTAPSIPGTV
jgi:hypothetical protein